MRTTINIDDQLLADAAEYTGVTEKATLVRMGLQRLVQTEAARRLRLLGGTQPDIQDIPRRRSEPVEE